MLENLTYDIVVIVLIVVSFCGGWKFRNFYALRQLDKLGLTAEDVRDMVDGYVGDEEITTVELKIESVEDTFYVYRADTQEFLGQGKVLKEILLDISKDNELTQYVLPRSVAEEHRLI